MLELTEEHVMQVVEAAYPNPVTLTELARERVWDENKLVEMFSRLQARGLMHALVDQPGSFTRAAHSQNDVVQVSNFNQFNYKKMYKENFNLF